MIHTFCWYCTSADGLPLPVSGAIGTDIRGNTTRLSYDRTLSPTLLLHLGAGFAQNNLNRPPLIKDYDACGQLGLCGLQFARPAQFAVLSGANNVQGGLASVGAASATDDIQEQPTAVANLTWVRNNHTYKFGGSVMTVGGFQYNISTLNGTYAFSNLQTALPYVAATNATGSVGGNTIGFPYASFLLGLVSTGNVHDPAAPRLGKSQW